MASEDRIVMQIALDHQAVLDGLEEIKKSTTVMEKSSNASIRNIGKNLGLMSDGLKRVADLAKTTDLKNLDIPKKSSDNIKNLRKEVEKFNKDAAGLAAGIKDATAIEVKDPISGQTLSAAKSFLQDMQQIARIYEQINSLSAISANLMSRNDEAAKRQAATYQTLADNVAKGLDKASTPGKGFGLGLDELEDEIKDLVSNAKTELKTLEDSDLDFAKVLKLRQAKDKLEDLKNTANSLFAGGGEGQAFGEKLKNDINVVNENLKKAPNNVNAFITSVNALNSSFNQTLKTSQVLKDELKRIKIDPETENVNLGQINAQAQKLNETITNIFETGNQEASKFANNLDSKVAKALVEAGKDSGKMLKALKDGNKELNEFVRTLPDLKEEMKAIGDLPPIFDEKKLNTRKVEAEVKRLTTSLVHLQKSNSQSVKNTGNDYQKMGDKIVAAFRKGDISAEEAIKALRRVRAGANETGTAFKDSFDEVERSSGRSTVSIWKVGTAMDRVGIRGAGGITRVVDAFKAMPIPIIAAAVAVGGLLLVLNKVLEAVVELGKKAARAFLEFTKGSVTGSKELEVLERQLKSFLGGSEELATLLRDSLLNLGLVVGQDLTKGFARTLVPLTSSQEQIESLAEDLATLSFSLPGLEFENAITIFRQMVSNQFRGAKLTFGLKESDIKKTQAFQEEVGSLQGALQGLEAFMQRRGFNFDELTDSMALAEGRLKAFRSQMELAFGEPIRDEIGEQLNRISDFLDENKDEIFDFASFVGEAIGNVVGEIGDFLFDFISSFDDDDVEDLKDSVEDVRDAALELVDSIRDLAGEDFVNFKKALNGIVGLLEKAAKFSADISGFLAGPGTELVNTRPTDTGEFEFSNETVDKLGKDIESISQGAATIFMKNITNFLKTQDLIDDETADRWMDGLSKGLVEITEGAVEQANLGTALGQGFMDQLLSQTVDSTNLNLMLEYNAALGELDEIAPEAAEAQKDINEAMDALDVERISKEMKLVVDMERKLLKLENDFSRKREEIHIKQGSRIEEINIDWRNSLTELELDFDRKGEDILRDYNRKIEDLEQDSVDKKIDIEKKFRDRLKEIRAKFDFDAQEAIRMNDAVALLRIRRRMAFELQQAKDKRDDETKGIDEVEEKKRRDLQVWLDRQEEDAKTSEDRKLADLITADANKRAELFRQYKAELDAQRRSEQQKRDDLEQWRDWQEEDNQTWWDESIAKLDKNLEDEYNTIKKWKEAELRLARAMNAQITRAMTLNLSPFSSFGGGSGAGALDLFSSFGTGIRFRDLSPVQLTTGGMQHGGFQTPGTRGTMVGERGPEPFFPTQAGVIAPHVPLMMSTGIGPAGGGTINNDHSVNADISTLDPSQISPMQQTIMKSIFMDQMLALQFGE